jgi:MFS family permease
MGEISEREVLARVRWRLLPLLFVLYMVNILDRMNVGMASLQMLDDLDISKQVYGFCAGVFYVGYFVFEVPSNLLLARMGARRWISRILITWGLVTCATMAVRGPVGFAVLRVLLGVAEAGFFPGIILYLTYWFPARERARAVALFMIGSPITGMLTNPLSGAIMKHLDHVGGLRGWQWLFLLEGLPALALGFVVFYWLPDRPARAAWLSPAEQDWLTARVAGEEEHRARRHGLTLWQAMLDRRVLLLTGLYFTVAAGSNAVGFFLPPLLKTQFPAQDELGIGLLAVIPNACAVVCMVFNGWHSDRTGERRWHVAVPAFVAAAGWAVAAWVESPAGMLVGMSLAQAGVLSTLPVFWSLPTAFLSGAAAAGGIAWINSVGNLGGFAAPYLLGLSKDVTGSFTVGLLATGATLALGSALALCARHHLVAESATP